MVCTGGVASFIVCATCLSEDERRTLRLKELERRWANELKLRLLAEEWLKEGFRREKALREENESLRALLREKRMEASRMDEGVYLCTEHPEEW